MAQGTEVTLGWKERLVSLGEIGLLLQNAWDRLPPSTERAHLEAEDPSPSITDCASKENQCSEGPKGHRGGISVNSTQNN